jgi:hypothetical protein
VEASRLMGYPVSDLVDYINAFGNLKFSVDKNIVTNTSAINVCIKINNKNFSFFFIAPKKETNQKSIFRVF